MKLTCPPQANFKLHEINTNLRQVCKFSKGENARILVYNTTIVLFLTQQYFFWQNEINSIIDSLRIRSRFWILPYFLYSFPYACRSKSVQCDLFALVVCFAANQAPNSHKPFFTLINTLLIGNIAFFKFITQTHFFFFFTLSNRKETPKIGVQGNNQHIFYDTCKT